MNKISNKSVLRVVLSSLFVLLSLTGCWLGKTEVPEIEPAIEVEPTIVPVEPFYLGTKYQLPKSDTPGDRQFWWDGSFIAHHPNINELPRVDGQWCLSVSHGAVNYQSFIGSSLGRTATFQVDETYCSIAMVVQHNGGVHAAINLSVLEIMSGGQCGIEQACPVREYGNGRFSSGPWQFLNTTWDLYKPWDGANPDYPFAAALGASNLLLKVDVDIDVLLEGEEQFVDNFTCRKETHGCLVWVNDERAAKSVFYAATALIEHREYLETMSTR